MEFPFAISQALDLQDGLAILNTAGLDLSTSKLEPSPHSPQSIPSHNKSHKEFLSEILDTLGKLSCQAQGLKHPVTTYTKFASSQANRIYIKADSHKIYGFLRVETKKITTKDPKGNIKDMKLVCVFDFYVHESIRRSGIGKNLYDKMLKTEHTQASKLAYKRPSLELLNFLKKYYGLTDPVSQPNSYIIFSSFWGIEQHTQHSPRMVAQRDLTQPGKDTEKSEEQKEDQKIAAFDLTVLQKFEKEPPKNNQSLIDLLLKAPSVLENNIFKQVKENPPDANDIQLFESEGAKKFYNEVYKWNWSLEKELLEESKRFKEKKNKKTISDEDF